MTSNKIYEAVPVLFCFGFFSVVINNRGVSHSYSCVREGYISFWKFRHGTFHAPKTATTEAIECNRYFPVIVKNEFSKQPTSTAVGYGCAAK